MSSNRPRGAIVGIATVAVVLVFVGLVGVTVVSTEDEEALSEDFDPVTYVDGVWEEVQATIRDEAVDLAVILGQIEPDAGGLAAKEALTSIAEANGLITTGEAHVYRVSATGTVTDVDTSTSRGTLGLEVDGYDGPIEVRVYIGTRIPSDESSIRDAAGFIAFGDFRDQTEYGKVSAEINKRVVGNLAGLDPESLVGKQVALDGAFTLRTFNLPEIDVSELTIVPIEVAAP